jgi:hypothetical protein
MLGAKATECPQTFIFPKQFPIIDVIAIEILAQGIIRLTPGAGQFSTQISK